MRSKNASNLSLVFFILFEDCFGMQMFKVYYNIMMHTSAYYNYMRNNKALNPLFLTKVNVK